MIVISILELEKQIRWSWRHPIWLTPALKRHALNISLLIRLLRSNISTGRPVDKNSITLGWCGGGAALVLEGGGKGPSRRNSAARFGTERPPTKTKMIRAKNRNFQIGFISILLIGKSS
jgi:hypothetical protein